MNKNKRKFICERCGKVITVEDVRIVSIHHKEDGKIKVGEEQVVCKECESKDIYE